MRLPPGARTALRGRRTLTVLKSMLNARLGVASAYRSSHGIGRVSFVSIAITTVGPYGIDVSAECVSPGRSRIRRAAS